MDVPKCKNCKYYHEYAIGKHTYSDCYNHEVYVTGKKIYANCRKTSPKWCPLRETNMEVT